MASASRPRFFSDHGFLEEMYASLLLPNTVAASFPEWVNMKAVHVVHVRPDERIFLGGSSYSEALEAGVAATQVGSGCIAYVGDVNAEAESNKVILALCGF